MPAPAPFGPGAHPRPLPTPLLLLPRSRRWQARWVWTDEDPGTLHAVGLFRTRVAVPPGATGLTLHITAIAAYRLWVDGVLLADGPPLSAPHHLYYDSHQVPAAAGGAVTLAILVHTQRHEWPLTAGLLAELVSADGRVLAATGPQWKADRGAAWRRDTHWFRMNVAAPHQEHCDTRLLPEGWEQPSFDDASWPAARVVQATAAAQPWQHEAVRALVPRDIAPLERSVHRPRAVVTAEECLGIFQRTRDDDLAPSLSQAGRPPQSARLEGVDHLIDGSDGCVLAPSDPRPADPLFDGVHEPCLTLDFGEILTAWLEVEWTGPAGTRIEIGTTERLFDGRFQIMIEGPFAEMVIGRGGRQVFRSLAWRSVRYLRLRVRHATGPVRVHAVRAIRGRTPLADQGTFASPDGELMAIDRICRATVRLCCVDAIMDTPWREAAQWLGDIAAVTLPALHWCHGETALAGKFLVQAGLNATPEGILSNLSNRPPAIGPRNIPDYSLWWIQAIEEHYVWTGDDAWVHTFWPDVQRIVRWHLRYTDDEGFLHDLPGWVFLDWAHVHPGGCSATYNALFAGTLDVVTRLAGIVGDANTADWAAALAASIRAGFAARFWHEAEGRVLDALAADGPVPRVTEHAQAAAILWDCLEPAVADGLVARAWEADTFAGWVECQPFFTRVVLRALVRRGRTDLALRVIRARWGGRFLGRGFDSCGEEWTVNGSWRTGTWLNVQRTVSHAWSACPAEFFLRDLPGIEILQPGGGRVRVRPHAAPFDYAVEVPLAAGPLRVACSAGRCTIEAAAGIEVVRA